MQWGDLRHPLFSIHLKKKPHPRTHPRTVPSANGWSCAGLTPHGIPGINGEIETVCPEITKGTLKPNSTKTYDPHAFEIKALAPALEATILRTRTPDIKSAIGLVFPSHLRIEPSAKFVGKLIKQAQANLSMEPQLSSLPSLVKLFEEEGHIVKLTTMSGAKMKEIMIARAKSDHALLATEAAKKNMPLEPFDAANVDVSEVRIYLGYPISNLIERIRNHPQFS